jgi:iron complex outermembrane recepter protein
MYSNYIRLSILFLCLLSVNAMAQNKLAGKVSGTDNKPVPYARIYIEDLKIGAACDAEGAYTLDKLPEGSYVVEVDALGYEAKAEAVKIKGVVTHDFVLKISPVEEQEVVVTGNSSATDIRHTPQPVTEVSHDFLLQNASTNIIDAITKVPGVSAITDGQSIAKPVIRGLGYNRVVTVNDGVRQEGQQWGDEFGIEVDPFSVDRVEILKGPASLVYGSDALAGVINFLPEKTMAEGEVKGDILAGYQTNNGLYNTAGHVAGTLNGISFGGRVDYTAAHAYQNQRDGYVFNSQFNNLNADGTIGIHRKWGFSQLHYSHFELRTGIAEGAMDSAGNFLKQVVDGNGEPEDEVASQHDLKSYTPFVIHQLVKHDKIVWDNSLAVGEGRIIGRFAMQTNSRQENNDITISNTSNIWYYLNTYNYDLRYVSPTMNNLNFSAGVNGMSQNSKNKGTLLLIPEYDLFDLGAFAIVNKKAGKFDISAGIRYDVRTFKGHDDYIDSNGNQLESSDPAAIHRFTAYTSNFNSVSGSLGAAYQVNNNVYLKANVSRGFRAPNVAESGSNGIKDGTVVYEIGQPTLKPEESLQFDFTPGVRSKDVTAELSVFYNHISNFIYAQQLGSVLGGDSLNNSTPGFPDAPVFMYSQTDATLTGAEAMLDIHPASVKWFDWYTGYSFVSADMKNVPDSLNIIPFISPARLRSEVTISTAHLGKAFGNSYFRIGVNHTFEATKTGYYRGDKLEPTPAYTLLYIGLGADIVAHHKKLFSVFLNVDNLTDLNYIDYLSRYKFATNFVNGADQKYVYNMGRNISMRILVPLDFSRRHSK